jgi:hypothetical protein
MTHVYVMGGPGTNKSTLIQRLRADQPNDLPPDAGPSGQRPLSAAEMTADDLLVVDTELTPLPTTTTTTIIPK